MRRTTDNKVFYGLVVRELIYRCIEACGYSDVLETVKEFPGEIRNPYDYDPFKKSSLSEYDKEEIKKMVEQVLKDAFSKMMKS